MAHHEERGRHGPSRQSQDMRDDFAADRGRYGEGRRSAAGSNYGDWRREDSPPPYPRDRDSERYGQAHDSGGGDPYGQQADFYPEGQERSMHRGMPYRDRDYYGEQQHGRSPWQGQGQGRQPWHETYDARDMAQTRQGWGENPGEGRRRYGEGHNDMGASDHSREHHAQFDPDYHQWRNEQMNALDEDYRAWRSDRYQKFSDEFSQWRNQRNAQGKEANQADTASRQQHQASTAGHEKK